VSLLPAAGAVDARKMASKRKMKISDNILMLPVAAICGHLVRAQARRKSA
jgi:hypothetical protein